MITYAVRTVTGSTYLLQQRDDGTYRLRAAAAPGVLSPPIDPSRWWKILEPTPWPPVVGAPIYVQSRYAEPAHAGRLPGGGRLSSLVLAVEARASTASTDAGPRRPPCPLCAGQRGSWVEQSLILERSCGRGHTRVITRVPLAQCADCDTQWVTVDAPPATSWSASTVVSARAAPPATNPDG